MDTHKNDLSNEWWSVLHAANVLNFLNSKLLIFPYRHDN